MLSLNAPGVPQTWHWLNAERIAKLPRGAVVANAGRGSLVDDAALIAALRSGHVAAAGLDVFEGEPELNPLYRELENVCAAAASRQRHPPSRATPWVRHGVGRVGISIAVLSGREPANRV